ncbi:DUF3466 family protein [Pirellulales bacterium]|nr:DUF3466 family protein [Pirellulales bacterium]
MTAKTALLLTALSIMAARPAAAAPYYKIADLTPDGYSSSVAYDINAHGDAVGIAGTYASGSLEEAYFYYDHSEGSSTVFGVGTVKPRSSIVGSGYREAAINDSGAIAGSAVFIGGSPHVRGFIYSGGSSGSFTNLGVLAGATATGIRPASDALDINNSGVATGTATSGAGTIGSENDNIDVYKGSSSPVDDIDGDITKLTRGDLGRALNDAGLVVGSNQEAKATLFNGAAETILLAGTALADDASSAVDINESGQVAGSTTQSSAAFLYDPTDGVTIIPNIGTGSRIDAKAINESGDVVGKGDRGAGLSAQARGYVYLDDDATSYILEDQVRDLSIPAVDGLGGWGVLRTAWGINDDGLIVGQGDRRFTGASFPTQRAYVLIPAAAPTGDLDGSGSYDGIDLLEWQRLLGNGVNSDDDLVEWESNYGAASAAAGIAGVPEPAAATLLGIAVVMAGTHRRSRCDHGSL